MASRPTVLLLPQEPLFSQLFPRTVMDRLRSFAEVVDRREGPGWDAASLTQALASSDACVTGWGSPKLTGEVVGPSPRLRILAHAAGTIRPVASQELFDRGIVVSTAHDVIARYVGEMTLGLAIAGLRGLPQQDRKLRGKEGDVPLWEPEELFEKVVGLVGLGSTARHFLRLLRPFDCLVLAFDPYVDPATASELGVQLLPLAQVLTQSRVVSLHAASVPETRHLVDRMALSRMQNGALLINTGRPALLDQEALVDELSAGRLRACLDVTDPEPLPPDHILLRLPNVMVTPHTAGPTPGRRWEMGAFAVEELHRFFSGQPLEGPAQPWGLRME
ncbi:MAG TPA: hydroxyacid dehydrogenase [Armatimonadota bacterium]|jgi:phosphoglycerate dehydrogenase-like enzyme